MGNTAFFSIVAPVGEPSVPPGSFSYSLIQLHEQASIVNVLSLSLWAVWVLSLLGTSNMLKSIKMSPFPLMFAKPVLSSVSSLEVYCRIVPRTQLPSSRNFWKSTTASAVGCRNLLSFLSICAQSEPVKCWRNNSYKLTSMKYFLFLFSSSPVCSFLVLLFFWWW